MSSMIRNLSYRQVLALINGLYRHAMQSLHLNCYQAFGYAYDETEYLRDVDDPSSGIISLTALFICADKHGVEFVLKDLFTSDVFAELSASYSAYNPNLFDRQNIKEDEMVEFLRDMQLVEKRFLS